RRRATSCSTASNATAHPDRAPLRAYGRGFSRSDLRSSKPKARQERQTVRGASRSSRKIRPSRAPSPEQTRGYPVWRTDRCSSDGGGGALCSAFGSVAMPSVLITGANRGLGLEFARQYCEDGHRVFAACRDPDTAEELRRLSGARLSVHRLDVGDPASIERLADELSEPSIDILINNAGINGPKRQRFGDIDYPGFEHTLRINTLGPLRVCEAFVDNVARSGRKLMV